MRKEDMDMGSKFYLAYGSNLNVEQMRWRCPDAEVVTTGMIDDYQLWFKGSLTGSYLTIEPMVGCSVPVAVWRVTAADIAALDRYEGFPSFYYKRGFKIRCADGRMRNCFAYIMHEERLAGVPSNSYVHTCLSGYKSFGFDRRYLQDALDISAAEMRRRNGGAA